MSLTTISVSRRVTTVMFFLGITLLGIITFTQIGVDFLPAVKIPELLVETDFSGAPPEEVEKTVTRPIEAVVSTASGVRNVRSVSREGRSLVTVSFYWGTNVDYAMLEVREKLDGVRGSLPGDAGRPTIFKIDPSTESIMTLAVSYQRSAISSRGSDVSASRKRDLRQLLGVSGDQTNFAQLAQLKEFVEHLVKRRLEQIQGVAQAAVAGGIEREIRVDVDPQKMSSLGLTMEDVAQALRNSNVNLEGGTINQGVFRYSLRTVGEFQSLRDIEGVVVKRSGDNSPSGGFPVNTFATVDESFAKREGLTRLNGKEAVLIFVKKEANTNTITVSKRVEEVIAQLNNDFPDVSVSTIFNQAEFIGKSISDIEQAIVFGALLALMVLFVFLRNPKYPLLIAVVTPISILATVVLMYFSGVSFNIISLTGLALGIGMIGDNAIIIVENFSRLREKGYSVVDAVIEGSKEINLSVAASTFTNVVIFLPVVFVKGLAQKLFLDMGLTMTYSLLASLLVAVTIVPSFLAAMKHGAPAAVPTLSRFSALYEKFMSWYMRFLRFSLDRPVIIIGSTAFLTLISLGTAFLIKAEDAPDIDQSRFVILVNLPPYSSLSATEYAVREIESVLRKIPEIEAVVSDVGVYSTEDYFEVLKTSINSAKIECRVRSDNSVRYTVDRLRSLLGSLRGELLQVGAEAMITRPSTTFERILEPRENDLDIEVIGNDLTSSAAIADSVVTKLKGLDYLTDVGHEGEQATREIWLLLNKSSARSYGIDMMSLTNEISDFIQGVTATHFDRFDDKYAIRVVSAASANEGNVLQTVLDRNVRRSSGSLVPVRELVKVEERSGYSSISHDDGQRAVVVRANVTTKGILGAANALKPIISKIHLPSGTQIKIGGKIQDIRATFTGLFIIVLLAIFLVYIILASEYESILYPLVVLTTSPLALVGAFIFMFIFGQTYNLMSMIGIVIMLGAIDNDAVIAVDMIISNRRSGMGLNDAIADGMKKRFRPIVMTTLTSILGVVPLVSGWGKGLELAAALSYPIIGGLIGSTLFTLFLIPVLYKYFDRLSGSMTKAE